MRWVAAVALIAAIGCGDKRGGAGPQEPAVPERVATAGDALLGRLPAGAQLVVEVDFARLRANPVVGPALAALAALPKEVLGRWAVAGGDTAEIALLLATGAEVAVLASYRVGSADAATLIAVRGGGLDAAVDVGDGVRVAGPEGWIARVRRVTDGDEPALTGDRRLMTVRATAMPAKATGAWLRLSAVLDFDARVALASRLELDSVPASLSLWSDVADDLALVALLGGDKPGEAKVHGRVLRRWKGAIERWPVVRWLGLAPTVGLARIDAQDRLARLILLVSPGRLARVADRVVSQLREYSSPQ